MKSINILFLLVILYLLIFFYYPLYAILKYAFFTKTGVSLENFVRVLSKITVKKAFVFTFQQAILSTVLSAILGIPTAYILTKYNFFGKKTFEAFLLIPFVLPGIVVGFAFSLLIGEGGLISNFLNNVFKLNWGIREWGFVAIILAHAFYNSPLFALMTASLWRRIDPNLDYAAETLGCYGFKKFYKVTLPILAPAILSAALITFIFSFTSFEVVLILGGFRYRTIEVEIYSLFTTRLDFAGAAALSLIQLMIMLALTSAYFWVLKKYSESKKIGGLEIVQAKNITKENAFKSILLIAYLTFYLSFIIVPIAIVVIFSFIDPVRDVITIDGYLGLFSLNRNPFLGAPPILAPVYSILFSTLTMFLGILLGLISAYFIKEKSKLSIFLNTLIFLPLAASRITMGLGIILGFGSLGILYQDTRPLILATHLLIAYPFVTRASLNGLSRLDQDLIYSSEILGVYGYKRFLKVDLPIILPSLLVGASLAFATSLGEFAATNILYRGNYPTLTVFLFLMISARRFVVASAAAALLIYLSLVSFFVILKSGEDLSSSF